MKQILYIYHVFLYTCKKMSLIILCVLLCISVIMCVSLQFLAEHCLYDVFELILALVCALGIWTRRVWRLWCLCWPGYRFSRRKETEWSSWRPSLNSSSSKMVLQHGGSYTPCLHTSMPLSWFLRTRQTFNKAFSIRVTCYISVVGWSSHKLHSDCTHY